MLRAVLGLGTNLGARRAIFACAEALFEGQPGCRVLARSSLYETPPLGPPQPDYLNAALLVEWAGSIEALFAVARHVEQLLGRERRERWGARTLDVDLLHSSEGPVRTRELEVPHGQLRARNFALAPLLEVCPELAPAYERDLSALGGPPPLARRGWPELEQHAGGVALVGDELEVLSLLASAFQRRTESQRARSALPFCVPAPLEAALPVFAARLRGAARAGFCVRGAAVLRNDHGSFMGVLVGEQVGACASLPEAGLARVPRGDGLIEVRVSSSADNGF